MEHHGGGASWGWSIMGVEHHGGGASWGWSIMRWSIMGGASCFVLCFQM